MRDACAMRSKVCLLFPTDHPPMFMRSRKLPPFKGPGSVSLPFFPTQAYGIGGLRKRPEAALLEDRDKPYVCDSECSILLGELQEVSGLRLGGRMVWGVSQQADCCYEAPHPPNFLDEGLQGKEGEVGIGWPGECPCRAFWGWGAPLAAPQNHLGERRSLQFPGGQRSWGTFGVPTGPAFGVPPQQLSGLFSLWETLQEPPWTQLPLHAHTPGGRGR